MNRALMGNTIRRKRMALGLTHQMLARMADMSRQTLSGIEHGRVNFRLQTIGRLIDILGLTLRVREVHPQAEGVPMRASGGAKARRKAHF